eukprot:scaffold1085_cov407-Prasinococcus_capsulatus_cf.AAC.56
MVLSAGCWVSDAVKRPCCCLTTGLTGRRWRSFPGLRGLVRRPGARLWWDIRSWSGSRFLVCNGATPLAGAGLTLQLTLRRGPCAEGNPERRLPTRPCCGSAFVVVSSARAGRSFSDVAAVRLPPCPSQRWWGRLLMTGSLDHRAHSWPILGGQAPSNEAVC